MCASIRAIALGFGLLLLLLMASCGNTPLEEAQNLAKQGNYESAISLLSDEVESDPENQVMQEYLQQLRMDAALVSAKAHESEGEYDRAIMAIDGALSRNPENSVLSIEKERLGHAKSLALIDRLVESGEYFRAVFKCRQGLRRHPGNEQYQNKFDHLEQIRPTTIPATIKKHVYGSYKATFYIVTPKEPRWPLLFTNPQNSFAFCVYHDQNSIDNLSIDSIPKNIFMQKGWREKPKADEWPGNVRLSGLDGFSDFYSMIQGNSKADLAANAEAIQTRLAKSHNRYREVFGEYLRSYFEVSHVLDISGDPTSGYDYDTQAKSLVFLWGDLLEMVKKTKMAPYRETLFDRDGVRTARFDFPLETWRRWVEGGKPQIVWSFVLKPESFYSSYGCGFSGPSCSWSLKYVIEEIVVGFHNSPGGEVADFRIF